MSMTSSEVLEAIFEHERHPLYPTLADWVKGDRRYRAFAERYRGKMRSKLRNATEPEATADLLFEFEIAHWLLQESRFEVEYETFDARQGGPDYTVAYRVNTRFNVEVRRIRSAESGDERVRKLVEILASKVKQMPPSAINLLVISLSSASAEDLAEAGTILRGLAERKVEDYFTRRGFKSAADFLKQYRQLSAVAVKVAGTPLWFNPIATHPLPKELALALERLPT